MPSEQLFHFLDARHEVEVLIGQRAGTRLHPVARPRQVAAPTSGTRPGFVETASAALLAPFAVERLTGGETCHRLHELGLLFSAATHKNAEPVRLENDDEDVLERVEEQVITKERKSDETVQPQQEERSVLHYDRRQQTPHLRMPTRSQSILYARLGLVEHRHPKPSALRRRQHEGELKQAEGPDGKDDVLELRVVHDGVLFEQIEQFHDVKRYPEVDEE